MTKIVYDAEEPNKRPIVFDGGKFALLAFKMQNGHTRVLLYQEHGRKLKHGKRRKIVAMVDVK